MKVVTIGGVHYYDLFTYKSTDGVNWVEQMVNVSPLSANVRPDIKFINGKYFLTYNSGGNGDAHILTSTDLST